MNFSMKKQSAILPLITDSNAPFAFVEAFKALRTNVNFIAAEKNVHSFVITSAVPDEHASDTAANLALALAAEGKRVALVDCDMRRPTLHTMLHIAPDAKGLSDVLVGSVTLENALQQRTDLPLSVLTAGTLPSNPSEMLDRSQMAQLLETLKSQFDFVIVNAPPVAAVTDAVIVGQHVDGVFLAVRSKFAARESIQLAQSKLDELHIPIFGVVLTQFDTKHANKNSGYAYSYHY